MTDTKETVAIIDGDIYLHIYANAYTHTYEFAGEEVQLYDEKRAAEAFDHRMLAIQEEVGASMVRVAFSCPRWEGYRREIFPEYKLNRAERPELPLIPILKEYATSVYGTTEEKGLEADDVLSIWATSKEAFGGRRKVLVSIDKDMLTIPGANIYNPDHPDRGIVTPTREEADRFHLHQTLTGDSVDNYKGCPLIGEVKAARILDQDCSWGAVVAAYEKKGLTEEDALVQARLARLLRSGEYSRKHGPHLWRPTKKYTIYGRKKA